MPSILQALGSHWIVTDGAAGNELQALALSAALGDAEPKVWRLRAKWPWRALAPQFAPVLSPRAWLPPLAGAWPTLAIGAGRMGAAALLTLARASGERTQTVQILDPRISPARFDLVIAPRHDGLVGANVIAVDGSLHGVDDAWLDRERLANSAFAKLASPRRVILIGGPRRGIGFDERHIAHLARTLVADRQARGGSVVLIGSRRTPAAWRARLMDGLGVVDRAWFSDADGANPFSAALAWGEVFFVSADSINMQSESLGTGSPVYCLGDAEPRSKIARFQHAMMTSGRLRILGDGIESWTYEPLREMGRILPLVRASLAR